MDELDNMSDLIRQLRNQAISLDPKNQLARGRTLSDVSKNPKDTAYLIQKERGEAAKKELDLVRESIPLKKAENSLEKKRIANNNLVLKIEETRITREKEKSRQCEIVLLTEKERTHQWQEQNRNIQLLIELEKIKRRSVRS